MEIFIYVCVANYVLCLGRYVPKQNYKRSGIKTDVSRKDIV